MIGTNIFSGFRSSVMIVLMMMMMVTCAGPEWSLIVGPYKAQPNSPPTFSSSILFSNRTAKDLLEEALLIPNSIYSNNNYHRLCLLSEPVRPTCAKEILGNLELCWRFVRVAVRKMVNLELLCALQCAQGEEVVRKMVTSAKQGSQGGKERSKVLWKFLHAEAFAPSQMSLTTWASTKL